MTKSNVSTRHRPHVCSLSASQIEYESVTFDLLLAIERDEGASGLFSNTHHPDQSRIYNQAALLNSLIRNMVTDQQQRVDNSQEKDVPDNASSNESCISHGSQVNDWDSSERCSRVHSLQSTAWTEEQSESYSEMYNLLRLLSPGVKSESPCAGRMRRTPRLSSFTSPRCCSAGTTSISRARLYH